MVASHFESFVFWPEKKTFIFHCLVIQAATFSYYLLRGKNPPKKVTIAELPGVHVYSCSFCTGFQSWLQFYSGIFWFRFSENLSVVSIPRPRATWSWCSFGYSSQCIFFVDFRDDLQKIYFFKIAATFYKRNPSWLNVTSYVLATIAKLKMTKGNRWSLHWPMSRSATYPRFRTCAMGDFKRQSVNQTFAPTKFGIS